MLPSSESSLGGDKKEQEGQHRHTNNKAKLSIPHKREIQKEYSQMKEAARTLKCLLPKSKLKVCAFGLSVYKAKGRQLTDHPQHKDLPSQGTGMETSSPPEGLRFREIKRPGSLAPGNGKTRREHMPPHLAAAPPGLE